MKLKSVGSLSMLPWGKSLLVLLLHAHALFFNQIFYVKSCITLTHCCVVQQAISVYGVANIDVCTSITKDLNRVELTILNRVMQGCFSLVVLHVWVRLVA